MKTKIFSILKKELREVFRDKKSLSMMLIIPLMIPLLIIGMSYLFDYQINKSIDNNYHVGFNYKLNEIEEKLTKKLNFNYKIADEKELKKLLETEKLDFYITKNNNKYIINYDKNKETSPINLSVAEQYLNSYKNYLQANFLNKKNINSNEVLNILTIDYKNISKENNNFYVNYITTYAFLFIIMAITISATYPSTDTTAGEKERGTLETLLTFPLKNSDIILGKYLSVFISSIITGLLSFLFTIFSLIYVNNSFKLYANINVLPNISTSLITIFIIICYSALISGLAIAIASHSKTFKEAQSALTPLTFISFFPGMIAFMINIKTTSLISIIPFLNFTQIFNDVNSKNINYLNISLMFISTIIYIGIILSIIIKQYQNEKILFSS